MRKPIFLTRAMLLAICGCAIAGCSATGRDDSGDPPPRVVTASGGERTRDQTSLGVGERLQVRLPAQAGTGYSWRLASDRGMNSIIWLERQENEPAGTTTPGGPAFERFTFRSIGPGTTTLRFAYGRPWETNVPSAREFDLSVEVK